MNYKRSIVNTQEACLELFKISNNPLNVDNLIVGIYRKFGKKVKRNPVQHCLCRMHKKGKIRRVVSPCLKGRGWYELTD